MNLNEAQSEAVQGAHLTADHLQAGSYLSYAFAGWRINFPGGSSSGFTPREQDEAADWRICGPVEAPRPAPAPSKWGKASVANSIEVSHIQSEPSWGEVFADKEATEGGWRDKPKRDKWGRPQ